MIDKEQIEQIDLLRLIGDQLFANIGAHKISIEGDQVVVTYRGMTRRRWITAITNVHLDAREYAHWFERAFEKTG